ncbi:MAG: DUF4136 domain-containing protein [Cytophagaceae bacterium]
MWKYLYLIPLLLLGCAREINSNVVRGVNFQDFKTYAWILPTEEQLEDYIVYRNIHHHVNKEMHERGFVADSVDPDILLDYRIQIREQAIITLNPVYPETPAPRPYWHPGPTFREHLPMEKFYEEGLLFIDVYEQRSNRHIWSGWSEEPIGDKSFSRTHLSSTIRRIFREFPRGK